MCQLSRKQNRARFRCGDPSKPSGSFGDKLRVLTRTESSGKLLRTPPGGRKPGPSHLTPNRRRLSKEELQSTHADQESTLSDASSFHRRIFQSSGPPILCDLDLLGTIILF